VRLTRGKAIRAKCLDCTCGNAKEVRECEITSCALWSYRMGYETDLDGKRICSRKSTPSEQSEDDNEN